MVWKCIWYNSFLHTLEFVMSFFDILQGKGLDIFIRKAYGDFIGSFLVLFEVLAIDESENFQTNLKKVTLFFS